MERKLAARRLLAAVSELNSAKQELSPLQSSKRMNHPGRGDEEKSGFEAISVCRSKLRGCQCSVASIADFQARQPVSKFDQLNKPKHRCKQKSPSLYPCENLRNVVGFSLFLILVFLLFWIYAFVVQPSLSLRQTRH